MPNRVTVTLGYTPRPWQAEFHLARARHRLIVIHRRGGKTTCSCLEAIEVALENATPNTRVGFISPLLQQSRRNAWPIIKERLLRVPGVTFKETTLEAILPNGATVAMFGGDHPDSIRGTYFDLVVLDEFGQMRPQLFDEVVLPALADRQGRAVVLGTPQGMDALASLYFRVLNDEGWYVKRLTYEDTGVLPAHEIESARANMSEAAFRREFLVDFEAGGEDAIIALEDARAAQKRVVTAREADMYPRCMGVDVARFGSDRSAIARRQGPVLMPLTYVAGKVDTMQLVALITREARDWMPQVIFVDVGGIGAGVFDRLRELGFNACPVDFGSKSPDPRCANLKAHIWSEMATWVKSASIPPDDDALLNDFTTPRYRFLAADSRMMVESKKDIKARGMPSPDGAEAVAVTFAEPIPMPGAIVAGGQINETYEHDYNVLEGY